jgi:ATP-dependent HslUV protease subunit HslV
MRSTTILSVRKDGIMAIGGDGQVTFGDGIMKNNAKKIRLLHNNTVITGFAGATADRILRRLDAMMCVADKTVSFIISGSGDIIEPENNIMAIGSGSNYAKAAALALMKHSHLNAEEIVRQSLLIAADICIYTNHNLTIQTLKGE